MPPLSAVWLNFRVARSMEFRNRRDYLFALLVLQFPRTAQGAGMPPAVMNRAVTTP